MTAAKAPVNDHKREREGWPGFTAVKTRPSGLVTGTLKYLKVGIRDLFQGEGEGVACCVSGDACREVSNELHPEDIAFYSATTVIHDQACTFLHPVFSVYRGSKA